MIENDTNKSEKFEKFWNYLGISENIRHQIARRLNPILTKCDRQTYVIKRLEGKNLRLKKKVRTLKTLLNEHLTDDE